MAICSFRVEDVSSAIVLYCNSWYWAFMVDLFLSLIFLALLLSLMPLNLLYFRNLRKVVEIMELRLQEEWKSIGRPRLDLSLSARNSFLLSRHILLGRYEGSGDDELIKHGRRCRLFGILGFIAFVALVILGLFLGGVR